jgi:CDP-Glycerol:Poly(glycerophosphate) glycerophosphotransferase
MSLNRIVELAQKADTRLQRWRDPASRTVLLNARTPMNYAVMAPIHGAMKEDSRVKFYFMASESPERTREIYPEAPEAGHVNPRRAAIMKFDAYLAADLLWVTLPRGTRRIQMFHGVAGKYGHIYDRPDTSMRAWDRLFFINRKRLKNFIASGAIDPDSRAARLVGMPKLDCLLDGSLERNAVLSSLGLDPSRKAVLYAPTWSPYSSLNAMGEELVARLTERGYSVIVKLHDRSRDPEYVHSGGVDWIARLDPILRSGAGLLATGSDACPYMAAADLLITDHSSVGFEYLLLDRPVVRIEMPELIAKTDIHPDYVTLLTQASTSARDVFEAVNAVERALSEPAGQSSARKRVASELFHEPGTATRRAVRELYEVLELDQTSIAVGAST